MISGPRQIQFELCAKGTYLAFPFLCFFFLWTLALAQVTHTAPPQVAVMFSSSHCPSGFAARGGGRRGQDGGLTFHVRSPARPSEKQQRLAPALWETTEWGFPQVGV